MRWLAVCLNTWYSDIGDTVPSVFRLACSFMLPVACVQAVLGQEQRHALDDAIRCSFLERAGLSVLNRPAATLGAASSPVACLPDTHLPCAGPASLLLLFDDLNLLAAT